MTPLQIVISTAANLAGLQSVQVALGNFRSQLPARIGQVAAAWERAVAEQIAFMDGINKLSQKIAVGTENLSALAYAAELADVSVGELQMGVKDLNEWLAKNGQTSKDTYDALIDLADQFATMPDGPQKTAIAMERLGRSGISMIPMLNQGGNALRDARREAEQFGLIIDSRAASQSEHFNDQLTRLRMSVQGLWRQVAVELLPSLIQVVDVFVALAKEGGALHWVAQVIGSTFSFIVSEVKAMFELMARLESLMRGWGWDSEFVDAFKWAMDGSSSSAPITSGGTGSAATSMGSGKDRVLESKLFAADRMSGGSIWEMQQRAAALGSALDHVNAKLTDVQMLEEDGGRLVYTEEFIELTRTQNDLLEKGRDLRLQIADAQSREYASANANNLTFQLRSEMTQLAKQWGTMAQQMARAITGTVANAVQGLSNALANVIVGTQSAAQAFSQFALQMLTSFIASILQMIIWAKVAIPILTALGILSGGTVPATGAVATPAALSAGMAAAMGAVHFASGGPVFGGEQLIRVNERGPEFVMSAYAVRHYGLDVLSRMNASPGAADASDQTRIVIVDDRRRAEVLIRDPRFRSRLVDLAL